MRSVAIITAKLRQFSLLPDSTTALSGSFCSLSSLPPPCLPPLAPHQPTIYASLPCAPPDRRQLHGVWGRKMLMKVKVKTAFLELFAAALSAAVPPRSVTLLCMQDEVWLGAAEVPLLMLLPSTQPVRCALMGPGS